MQMSLNNLDFVAGNPPTFTVYGMLFRHPSDLRVLTLCAAGVYTVTSLTTASGPIDGGTLVSVIGTSFVNTGEITVKFGAIAVNGTFVSATVITATAPAQSAATVTVAVALNGVNYVSGPDFLYYSVSQTASLSPPSGPIVGGTYLTVIGSGFSATSNQELLRFNNLSTNATVSTSTVLFAVSPAIASAGAVAVELALNGQQFIQLSSQFEYYSTLRSLSRVACWLLTVLILVAQPNVTAPAPSLGPTTGGTIVTVVGTGFVQTAATVGVRFGVTSVPGVILSASWISCVSPSGSGTATVAVALNGVDYVNATTGFLYYTPPTTAVLSPPSGPTTGGTNVTLSGTGFVLRGNASVVVFGSSNASATVITSTLISVVTPAAAAVGYVALSLNGQQSLTLTPTFLYQGTSILVYQCRFVFSDDLSVQRPLSSSHLRRRLARRQLPRP